MPSITYLEESQPAGDSDLKQQPASHEPPEPPSRYDANSSRPPSNPGGNERSDYDSARRLVTISQIMALISFVIGGVVLAAAALIVSISAFRKIRSSIEQGNRCDTMPWEPLKRYSAMSVVFAAFALAANIVALIIIYPMVIEAMQSGDYASLLSGTAQQEAPSTGTGNSTWG